MKKEEIQFTRNDGIEDIAIVGTVKTDLHSYAGYIKIPETGDCIIVTPRFLREEHAFEAAKKALEYDGENAVIPSRKGGENE
jgi:hypothetical protein